MAAERIHPKGCDAESEDHRGRDSRRCRRDSVLDWQDPRPSAQFYPGQQGSTVLPQIILGDHSPEGHLPFSWERDLGQNPTSAHYAEEPGDDRAVHYSEGMFLGYRFYTSMNEKPLFQFGFGMSYTMFALSRLSVEKHSEDDVQVSFDPQNTGTRSGADVAQVYVGDSIAKVKRPLMELKQFTKVRLESGEKQHVVQHLNKRAFSYYDLSAKNWRIDPGQFEIYVGDSLETIALSSPYICSRWRKS